MNRRKIGGKVAARALEEYAFMLDMMHIPLVHKQQLKLIHSAYYLSNHIRRSIGEEPKMFKRLIDRNTVEVIT